MSTPPLESVPNEVRDWLEIVLLAESTLEEISVQPFALYRMSRSAPAVPAATLLSLYRTWSERLPLPKANAPSGSTLNKLKTLAEGMPRVDSAVMAVATSVRSVAMREIDMLPEVTPADVSRMLLTRSSVVSAWSSPQFTVPVDAIARVGSTSRPWPVANQPLELVLSVVLVRLAGLKLERFSERSVPPPFAITRPLFWKVPSEDSPKRASAIVP